MDRFCTFIRGTLSFVLHTAICFGAKANSFAINRSEMRHKMKKKLAIFISVLLLVMQTGCSFGSGSIRFGTAAVGGVYQAFADSFTSLISKDNDKYRFEKKTTAGSAANLRLLSSGYIDLGIAQADLIQDAYYGEGTFKGKSTQGYKAIANLYPEACQIVVRKDSGIQSLDDLEGKTVSVGEEESGTERNAEQILSVAGLTSGLVNKENLNYTEAADKLSEGEIDAMFCTSGVQTTVIEELARDCDITLLGMDSKLQSRLKTAYPYYSDYTIAAGTYSGVDTDIATVCVQAVLVAADDLSDDTVYDITSFLFDHAKDIQYTTAIDIRMDVQTSWKNIPIPLHDGAARYYEEQGVKVNAGEKDN